MLADRKKEPGISHVRTKSTFSYHPSTRDQAPRHPNKISKPGHQQYADPSKFARDLVPQDLKVLDHGGKEAYLQITPISKVYPNLMKPIGGLKNYPSINNGLNYKPNQQSLRNYDAALYMPHTSTAFNPLSYGHLYSPKPHASAQMTSNTFKGTSFPHSEVDALRTLNDAKRGQLALNTLLPGSTYSSLKKAKHQPSIKDLYSSGTYDKINQVTNLPKSKFYSGFKAKSPLSPSTYNANQYPKSIQSIIQSNHDTSSRVPSETLIPIPNKNYKNTKYYLDPTIKDIPTLVDKEVEIVHIPANHHQYSSNTEQEVVYLKEHSPVTHYRTPKSEPETIVEQPLEFHIIEDEPNLDSLTASSHRTADDQESVFVGTRSLDSKELASVTDASADEKKQFFHAYYAPSDHSPPKGYLKMTPDEFQKLFKDAEIQYVQRSAGDGIRSLQLADKRSSES